MPPKKKEGRDWRTTVALALSCLVLGVPVAGVAISLEITFMPDVPLAQEDTIVNTSHIALFAAAFLSIASSVIVMTGTVILRHVSPNNGVVGLATFGISVVNQIAQLIILGLIYISNQVLPESKSRNEVRLVDGQYETTKQFTRETFSCMMGNLYLDREPWSTNACSEYHYARYTTILMSVTAFLLLGIGYWPVRKTLFGRSTKVTAMQSGGKA